MIRDDLSDRLIHFTRGELNEKDKFMEEAVKRFSSILAQKKLVGGTGYIKGKHQCVCFTEAPVSKLSHILATPTAEGLRYAPYGVMVTKKWLFKKGGRPAIYGPDYDYAKLPAEMQYRHVRFWLDDAYVIDHTWEREWRLLAADLPFGPEDVTLIVPDRAAKEVLSKNYGADWHWLVLSDLGVPVAAN